MASVFCVFVFAACFLRVSGGRELVVADKEKLTSSFKTKATIDAAAYTFQDTDASIYTRRIRSRFAPEDTNDGKDLEAVRKTEEPKKMRKTIAIAESSASETQERSLIGANYRDRSPPSSVLLHVQKDKPSRSERFSGFDSDYCQPRTHPPSHN